MGKRVIVIFTEGETEYHFYQRLIRNLRSSLGEPSGPVKIFSLGGIGKFSRKALAKYKGEICRDYPGGDHFVYLAYDTDVFEFKQKPPVDWVKLEKELLSAGVSKVFHLRAERTIEDWFICDIEGICRGLGIKPPKRVTGETGLKKIQWLFNKASRTYQKGYGCVKIIEVMDIEKVYAANRSVLKVLINSH